MKVYPLIVYFLFLVTLAGCNRKSEDHAHHHAEASAVSPDPNKGLYDSVMRVHDEVMPKMDEMFRLTEALKEKIVTTPSLPEKQKLAIESAIDSLDHAGEGMMAWMRQFKPVTDTADRQGARDYLNEEMVKVTKVKTDILSAIQRAKELQ